MIQLRPQDRQRFSEGLVGLYRGLHHWQSISILFPSPVPENSSAFATWTDRSLRNSKLAGLYVFLGFVFLLLVEVSVVLGSCILMGS